MMKDETNDAPIICLTLISSLIPHPSSLVLADGGAVRFSAARGPYVITVFTAPVPFRAGPVDISVLVQDGASKEPVPAARVLIKATRLGVANPASIEQPATAAAATNKLYRAAVFELPEPGWYTIEVMIDGPDGSAAVSFEQEAAAASPHLPALWPWIAWPVLPILFFGMHQFLKRAERKPAR